jgi:hypothetical protein
MSRKTYVVELSSDEREHLEALISKGKSSAKAILKARILLKADQGPLGPGWTDDRIVEALDTNSSMAVRVRRQLVEEGVAAVLARKQRMHPPVQPIFDGEAQARLIALACSEPPAGHARWSIRLLADKVVELEIVETAHFNTVGRALKKRSQTASEQILGHSAQSQRRLRRGNGRCPGRLYPAARGQAAAGLSRRGGQATHRRDPCADPNGARAPGPPGL